MGTWDCGIFCADWCVTRWNVDPMQGVRGQYASMPELHAVLGTRSLPMIFDRNLRRAGGFTRSRQPHYESVAMIRLNASGVVCGAIATGKGYIVLAEGGLTRRGFDESRVIAAWTR